MAIIVTPETKVLVSGITGEFGGRHTKLSLDYGTKIVAGKKTLAESGLKIETATTMADAAQKIVKLVA